LEKPRTEWDHPGGKLIELGPMALKDEDLLAILIGSGYKGRSAQAIAKELLDKYYSIAGLLGKTSSDLSIFKGLKNGKIARIAASFEIAKRVFDENKWELPNRRLVKLELPELSDSDVLAVLIGGRHKKKTAKDLSKDLLNKFGSIGGLMGQKLWKMARIEGLGDVRVVRIVAAIEVARRIVRALEKE
jgi:DNA repair protein RadC